MRIAPRTMLCATVGWDSAVPENQARFAELRELCDASGDKVSLAIGMTGLTCEYLYAGRSREGAQLASEQMALLETIGDVSLTMGLAFVSFCTWFDGGKFRELLRWSQAVVDLAEGDPDRGAGFGFGSPLAAALAMRGSARWFQGGAGWQQDLGEALDAARRSTPETHAAVVAWTYGSAIQYGVLRADDATVHAIELALHAATASSSNVPVGLAKYTLGLALLSRDTEADRDLGLATMAAARTIFVGEHAVFLLPVADLWDAQENARRGHRDGAIPVMRRAVDELQIAGRLGYEVWGTGVLVETQLERGECDLAEAQEVIDRLANLPAGQGSAVVEITLLRLRALLARARGDNVAYRDFVGRYRAMAESLGYEGHIAWAEEMAETDAQRN